MHNYYTAPSILSSLVAESACAACGWHAQGNFSIHRDSMGEGPEVDLCDDCGCNQSPSCEELWAKIKARASR